MGCTDEKGWRRFTTMSGSAPAVHDGRGKDRILSQAELNIEDKSRTNLFAWRGQFSPQLVEAHLRAYGGEGAMVLDPFMGSGTVLVEAARLGMSAVGCDVNPAACAMARLYQFVNVATAERTRILDQAARQLHLLNDHADLPLFAEVSRNSRPPLSHRLQELARGTEPLHSTIAEALAVTANLGAAKAEAKDIRRAWSALCATVEHLPHCSAPVRAYQADARLLPVEPGTGDLVFTSPPYINVFNYHQQYRPAVEALGYEVLGAAKSEIGSNRKHRGNRFLTVIQYCIDMAQVLLSISRACRAGARMILVVGRESAVRKTPFYNGEIVGKLAGRAVQISEVLRQERVFLNRFGQDIFEDIIHLVVPSAEVEVDEDEARAVAVEALKAARRDAPKESRADLDEAIERADTVTASPLLSADTRRALPTPEKKRCAARHHTARSCGGEACLSP